MIVGDLKPLDEIAESISNFQKITIVACGGCVSICLSGGTKSADELARKLAHPRHYRSFPPTFDTTSIQRQCERDFVKAYLNIPGDTEAILSMACGAGVQTVAEIFGTLPVIPALNTTFLGSLDAPGIWREKCQGCGDCVLAYAGGVVTHGHTFSAGVAAPCGGTAT